MTSRLEIRPSVREDIAELGLDLPYRIRAMTGMIDGKVVGIAGITFLPDGTVAGFLQAGDEAREHRFALHRAAVRFLAEAKKSGVRKIVAAADTEIDAAERWLERLGFEPTQVNDETVWIWQHSRA